MRRILLPCVLAFITAAIIASAVAQTQPSLTQPQAQGQFDQAARTSAAAADLGTIMVVGRYPGPGLWKVRKGDHTMWILGSQNPLPRRMTWDSSNVERKIAASQQVLLEPEVKLKSGAGFFRNLTLFPSLFRALKNPDDKTLRDVVPPEQYAHWQPLKARYIGKDRDIETWRPLFAAVALYEKAIDRSGMSLKPVVADAIERAAKRKKVAILTPTVEFKIQDPKSALNAFSQETLDDGACFSKTLDSIEVDLSTMAGRANAWAEGDIETLRTLPHLNQFTACSAAFTNTQIARKHGMKELDQQLENEWMRVAENALANNTSTFAILPVGQLLQEDGYLAKLAAKGYVIEEP